MGTLKENTRIKWIEIKNNKDPLDFSIQLFDESCLANFYIGVSESNNFCILHDLTNVKIDFNGFDRTNLKAYKKNDKYLILEFFGIDEFFELFLDLSCVIFNTIKDISDSQESARIFKDLIIKWSVFFNDKKIDKLGEKEVMGLWGELFVLQKLIYDVNLDINDVLMSWKGSFNSNRDFEFPFIHIEVKTIKNDSDTIDISSEFQLELEDGISIKLNVIKVRRDEFGLNLKQLVDNIISEIVLRGGHVHLLYSAISPKVNILNLFEYDEYIFAVNSDQLYNVNDVNFPRLASNELKDGISKVRYKISLAQLDVFKIN
jgi:hypothetical protein